MMFGFIWWDPCVPMPRWVRLPRFVPNVVWVHLCRIECVNSVPPVNIVDWFVNCMCNVIGSGDNDRVALVMLVHLVIHMVQQQWNIACHVPLPLTMTRYIYSICVQLQLAWSIHLPTMPCKHVLPIDECQTEHSQ